MPRQATGVTVVQSSAIGNGVSSLRWLPDRWQAILWLAAFATLAGCGTSPPVSRTPAAIVLPQALGDEIVLRAMAQIGTPYRYGGADLEGFDCSGLVYYIHQQLGLTVPRTAQQQYDAAQRVARNDLQPGDLVFFRFAGARISHVGIYAGAGRFVHAPQTGRDVELKNMGDEYYTRHFAGAGRLQRAGGS